MKEVIFMSSIEGIGSLQGMMGRSGMRQSTPLTDEQKQKIQDILSNYDSSNVTANDAKSIFEEFRAAGIRPGKGMKETIEAAGFNAEQLRELGMPKMEGMPRMGGGQEGQALTDEQKSTITSILSKYDSNNLTTEDAQSIFQQFQDAGIHPGKGMKETIEAAGFDAEQLRELGKPKRDSLESFLWSSQNNNSTGINTSALKTLQEILNQYDLSNQTTEQKNSMITQLQSAGLLQSGNTINIGI
jgi:hypothetical protein